MKKPTKETFSPKEVGIFINNAVQACRAPGGKPIPDIRLRRLRAYALGVLEPLLEHTKTRPVGMGVEYDLPPALSSEELVLVLLTCALFVHTREVLDLSTLPAARVADVIFKAENK